MGRGQGLNPGQDIQAAQLAGCSQHRSSHICIAANATLLPEDGKEKAALPEERTENTRLLQGQEEDEEERLQDARWEGTKGITQDGDIQVSQTCGCCWGRQLGRECVASQDFSGISHGPGMCWAGLSHFGEKEGDRKGLGGLEWCWSSNEAQAAGRATASLTPGHTGRVCHLPASQVEKGKDLELKEQFDALRREHLETLQGACWDSRAHPNTVVPPPAPWHLGAPCPGVPTPVTLGSCSPCRAPEST